jgi:hypothetical protein
VARLEFGGELQHFVSASKVGPNLVGGTVWTAREGGSQVTDLLTLDGQPITSLTRAVVVGSFVRFYGPDDGSDVLWIDSQAPSRIQIRANTSGTHPVVVDESGGSYPARPAGAVCVIWRGETTPGGALDGDLYVNTGA